MPTFDPRPLALVLHLVYGIVGSWWPARRLRSTRGSSTRVDEAQVRAGGLDSPVALAAGLGRQAHVVLGAVVGNWPLAIGVLESQVVWLAGLVLSVGGISIAGLAAHQLGPSWRTGVDLDDIGALNTTGLYRLSRHPVIFGEQTLLLGTFLLLPNALGLCVLVGSIPAVRRIIRAEETIMRRHHGKAFSDYAARTPRLLPRPRLRLFE